MHANLFPDKNGDPSVHGFVEVGDEKYARRVVDDCKTRKLMLQGINGVKIKRAKTRIDMNRDWALHRAEEIIKEHPDGKNKDIKMERGSAEKDRGIYVNGSRVFEQPGRYSKDGVFLAQFAGTQLR